MNIDTQIIKVSFGVGTNLETALKECSEFCHTYKTEVKLKFNATTHTITRYTDVVGLSNHWYK